MDYISREDAIDCVLSQYCASSDETEEALGDVIDAIKALPSADLERVPSAEPQKGEQTMSDDLISRAEAIDAYIMKCPYFAGKNTIDRSNIGTHIGSCDLEHHYRKVCPSNECLCAERLGLKYV